MPIVTRSRKRNGVGEHKKRMQAAVQAILPLGFSRDLIFNTIQHLLQVYGGPKGWAFIEEESYKLVVETILGEEEPCSPKAGALDGRESNTGHIDIDLVDMKLNESKPLSKEDTKLEDFPDGDGTFNGDVGRKLSGPLDDTPDSIKAEVTCQKGLYVGMIESDSLEPSLGCNFDVNNSWESTGKNKVQNSMLAGVQGGLVQRDNLDTKVFLHNLILPEAEKSGEKEKGEESNKHGKELGEKHFLRDLTKDVSSFIHSLGKSSEPCVAQTTTVFSCSQNAVTSSCLMENVLQEACQMVPEQGADRISGSRGYANSTCITSLSSIGLQRQEVPLHSSNLYSSPHRDSSMPLKRKACFGWLSDDENSPERSDTAMLSNENFGKVKEIDSDAMATSQGICIIEKDSSEKNKEREKNIMHSNEKQISDKFSSEYDCRSIEEDKKRLSDRLFRPWMSLSKDMGDKCNRDKYEQTEAGKSVQKILAKLRHENEINDEVNCKFRKLQMDENIGGSRFIKASHKKQSSHEHETHRSDHRNSRIDGKHLWQLTNNNFSYNEKTSYHSRQKYRRSEPRRKYWSSQTIIKQHLEQDISCNQEGNFCEGHYRQEDERNSEQAKIISYNKKDTDNEDHGRKKDKESMHVIGKSSLRHEKKDFQDPKSAHNHHRRNGKVGDKFHSSIALPHTHFRNDHDTLPPKKHCKMSRWDVKPDFMK